nr:hypothetical protein [uncultured Friedmanniella sp.]
MREASTWVPWLRLALAPTVAVAGSAGGAVGQSFLVACPHCTNTDTLSPHCRDDRCGWAHCTCGALIYSRRRHRHPRHGTRHDSCRDPKAAV